MNKNFLPIIKETITCDDLTLKYFAVRKGIPHKWIVKMISFLIHLLIYQKIIEISIYICNKNKSFLNLTIFNYNYNKYYFMNIKINYKI